MKMKILLFSVFIIGAVAIIASPVKSMLGSNGVAVEAEEGAWENPYVTDGLVAMWDGEWNVAGGVHDEFLLDGWIDIIQGICLLKKSNTSSNPIIHSNCVEIQSSAYGAYLFSPYTNFIAKAILEKNLTIELCSKDYKSGFSFFGIKDTYLRYGLNRTPSLAWNGFVITGNHDVIDGKIGTTRAVTATGESDRRSFINGIQYSTYLSTTQNVRAEGFFVSSDMNGNGVPGKIFCIRIYNRALSSQELNYNYLVDKERFDLP